MLGVMNECEDPASKLDILKLTNVLHKYHRIDQVYWTAKPLYGSTPEWAEWWIAVLIEINALFP